MMPWRGLPIVGHAVAIEERDADEAALALAQCSGMDRGGREARVGGVEVGAPDAPFGASGHLEEQHAADVVDVELGEVAGVGADAEQIAAQLPDAGADREGLVELAVAGVAFLHSPQGFDQFPHERASSRVAACSIVATAASVRSWIAAYSRSASSRRSLACRSACSRMAAMDRSAWAMSSRASIGKLIERGQVEVGGHGYLLDRCAIVGAPRCGFNVGVRH